MPMNGVQGITFHINNHPVAIPNQKGSLNMNPNINPIYTGLDSTANTIKNIFKLSGSINFSLAHLKADFNLLIYICISVNTFVGDNIR